MPILYRVKTLEKFLEWTLNYNFQILFLKSLKTKGKVFQFPALT
jgi:hypothetical protein